MTRWFVLAAPVAVLAATLVIPGVVLALAARIRGILAIALAPALGAGVVASASVVAPWLGLRWSEIPVALVTVVGVAVVAALRWWLRPGVTPRGTTPRALARVGVAAVIVAGLGAAALQATRLVRAIGTPDAIAQSYDTVFHLNAVAFVLDTGNASPLAMTMGTPGSSGSFYPTLWHALTALGVQLSGVSVPEATNATALVCVLVIWPLSALALARAMFGQRPIVLAAVAGLAFSFAGFPNRLLSFGILYPNLLGYALLPAVLGLVVVLVERARGRAVVVVGLLTVLALVGLVCAHANAVVAFLAMAAVYLLAALTRWTSHSVRAGSGPVHPVLAWMGAVVVLVALVVVQRAVPTLAYMSGRAVYPVQSTFSQAVHDVFDLSTPSAPLVGQPFAAGVSQPVLAALVLVGLVVALRVPAWRWLSVGYLLVAALWVVDVAWESPWRAALTGYWYSDSIRLAALVPALGLPLAALGVLGTVRLAAGVGGRVVGRLAGRRTVPVVPVAAVVALLLLAVAVAGRTPATRESFRHVRWMFSLQPDEGDGTLLDARERAFLDRVASEVPADDEVVGNPWDGSALVWALDGRRVVYPNIGSTNDVPRALVAADLSRAREDPQVCAAVQELNAYYVLILGEPIWGQVAPDDPALGFTGLYGAVETGVATVVDSDGDNQLLRVTACG